MQDRPELRMAPEGATRWDWWPLARLLIVLATFAAFAHLRLGWTVDLASLATLPRRSFEVFSVLTVVSSGLAHLYLMFLAFPIYAVVTLNDTFYEASRKAFTSAFPGSNRLADMFGLAGELALFGVVGLLLQRYFPC